MPFGGLGVRNNIRKPKRKKSRWFLTFAMVLLSGWPITILFIANRHHDANLEFSSMMHGSNPWKFVSAGYGSTTTAKTVIPVLLDVGIPLNFSPLHSLLDQYGSKTIQLETRTTAVAGGMYSEDQWKQTINAPCIWVSKNSPSNTNSSSDNSNNKNNLWQGPPHCFWILPSIMKQHDFWMLQAPSIASNKEPTICLTSDVGPRSDFFSRGRNFEHVGLWMQSSSIRTHRLNLALLEKKAVTAMDENFQRLFNKNGTLVLRPQEEEYKPIQYLHDLLTSVFTVVTPQFTSFPMPFWTQLQEVILAGSIPIVMLQDEDDTPLRNSCSHDRPWLNKSPLLRITSMKELDSILESILWKETPQQWNERQVQLRHWYLNTMTFRAFNVEQFLLQSSSVYTRKQQLALEGAKALLPDFLETRTFDPIPNCLRPPFYGRTNNKVIEIGKVLRSSHREGKKRALGFDRRWSNWFRQHFDDREDVILDYYPHGECHETYNAKEAFELGDWDLSYLSNLLPAKAFRTNAESILQHWPHGNNYISVHRRDLERSCHVHARCSDVDLVNLTCHRKRDPNEQCSTDLRLQACNMEYKLVPNPEGLPVVLFTDGQVPALDATFPHKFNATDFFVEMWLMVQSKTHWGNPRSTVDSVVASWRKGKGMEPKACY